MSRGPLTITTTSLPAATVGHRLYRGPSALGRDAALHLVDRGGILPDGLILTPASTGVISGTRPRAALSFTVQVSAGEGASRKPAEHHVSMPTVTIWPSNPVPGDRRRRSDNPRGARRQVPLRDGRLDPGIRFYKSAANSGTHMGNLWSITGTELATVTFSGETATGWQQVNFATPVAIQANTVYVASYFSPNGHYSGEPRLLREAGRGQRRRCTR